MAGCVQVFLVFVAIRDLTKVTCENVEYSSFPSVEYYGILASTEKWPIKHERQRHTLKKRDLIPQVTEKQIELEEENDDLSRLPDEEPEDEMDTSATAFMKFPVLPPPVPIPPPEAMVLGEFKLDTGFHTDIKKSIPVFNYLKEAEEKKEIEKPVVEPPPPEPVPPPPPPPPPPPIFMFESHKKEEKDVKFQIPPILEPIVSRTRMALRFGNVLVQALTKIMANTELAINKYVKPKEE